MKRELILLGTIAILSGCAFKPEDTEVISASQEGIFVDEIRDVSKSIFAVQIDGSSYDTDAEHIDFDTMSIDITDGYFEVAITVYHIPSPYPNEHHTRYLVSFFEQGSDFALEMVYNINNTQNPAYENELLEYLTPKFTNEKRGRFIPSDAETLTVTGNTITYRIDKTRLDASALQTLNRITTSTRVSFFSCQRENFNEPVDGIMYNDFFPNPSYF